MTETASGGTDRASPIARLFTAYAGLQIVLALASLVRNKVTAVTLGPAKYGEFAQLLNVTAFLVAAASLGMGVALGRALAVTDEADTRRSTLGTAMTLATTVSAVVSIIALGMVLGGGFLTLTGLPSAPETKAAAVVAVVAVPVTCIQGLYIAALQGLLDAEAMARSRGVAVAGATVLAVPVIIIWGLVGAAVSAVLLALFTAVALAGRLRTLGLSPLALRWDRPALSALLALGLASMASSVAHSGADLVSRGITLAHVGTRANGLIQAPLSVTALAQGVLLGSIGAMSVAVLARANGTVQMRHELHRMLDFVLPFAALGFAVIGAFAPLVLRLLFSGDFGEAQSLFLPVLLYQFTVVLYWICGSPLLAAGRARLWLGLELIGAVAKVGFAWWLVPRVGTEGLPLSLLLFALLHLVLNIVSLSRALEMRISVSRYAASALAAGVIAACWWLPSLGPAGMAATGLILAATSGACLRAFRSNS